MLERALPMCTPCICMMYVFSNVLLRYHNETMCLSLSCGSRHIQCTYDINLNSSCGYRAQGILHAKLVSSYGAFKALTTPKSITTLNHIHKVNVVLSYRYRGKLEGGISVRPLVPVNLLYRYIIERAASYNPPTRWQTRSASLRRSASPLCST
jgi:hypothetical protein